MSRYSHGQIDIGPIYNSLVEDAGWDTRLTPKAGLWYICYGFDHACGYFVQLFPKDSIAEEFSKKQTGSRDGCIDIDSLFNSLTGSRLGYLLKLVGGNSSHYEKAYLDLPF